MNNHMRNNNLVSGFQNFSSNNIPFNNNQMLNNNPAFYGSLKDPHFFQRLQQAKMEQLKRAKNVNDLGISKDELLKYVICPTKSEKLDKDSALKLYSTKENEYTDKFQTDMGKLCTNMPYKNILKNENYKKDFKTKDDLIVSRLSDIDRDKYKLLSELEVLSRKLETHNKELKVIYSAGEENKWKEEFEYVTKYKYRLKHDPKNFAELNMIEELLQSSSMKDISQEDLDEFKKLSEMEKNEDENIVKISIDNIENDETPVKKQKEVKVETRVIKVKKQQRDEIGHVDDNILDEYKNREKKK